MGGTVSSGAIYKVILYRKGMSCRRVRDVDKRTYREKGLAVRTLSMKALTSGDRSSKSDRRKIRRGKVGRPTRPWFAKL